jgi:hypothetical protein
LPPLSGRIGGSVRSRARSRGSCRLRCACVAGDPLGCLVGSQQRRGVLVDHTGDVQPGRLLKFTHGLARCRAEESAGHFGGRQLIPMSSEEIVKMCDAVARRSDGEMSIRHGSPFLNRGGAPPNDARVRDALVMPLARLALREQEFHERMRMARFSLDYSHFVRHEYIGRQSRSDWKLWPIRIRRIPLPASFGRSRLSCRLRKIGLCRLSTDLSGNSWGSKHMRPTVLMASVHRATHALPCSPFL